MDSKKHDLVVIGSGPGGYVAAIRAAQLGLNVACVEKDPTLGGTCLNVGCIPSKALLESSERYESTQKELAAHGVKVAGVELDFATLMDRKNAIVDKTTKDVESLFRMNKITRSSGTGRIASAGKVVVEGDEPVEIEAKHILIATGSASTPLDGVEVDGGRIGTSTAALSYSEVPKRLIVIGAGYIGMELGSVWRRLGSQVTMVEYLDQILPGVDVEIVRHARRAFEEQGLTLMNGARVTGARVKGKQCVVEIEGHKPLRADRVLLAVGRVPYVEGLGLEQVGVELTDRGRVRVDEQFQTSVPGIYAIGDVIEGPMLAHKASDEGIACVERIVTGYGHVNYDAIPAVVYTEPEIAMVGRTEEQLKEQRVEYRKGLFRFKNNGRARALGHLEGIVKVLAAAATDRVLGVHIVGPRAGDLIAEAAVAIEYGASSEDLARACHAHPTLSEALKEAALAVDDRAIHA
ncbi:MAG: dihydrolipoyl dehydrogenase [Deltaproteobacteria bacterium]|nr:dihydrolipoyl dehydrogenase [Deltaproteobacteria bacterium]